MQTPESIAYGRHKNLKLAAIDLGIPWQTLYVMLRRQGVPVTGDKRRYGTDSDRLGAMAEELFSELVPSARSMNDVKFQAKYDFDVLGHKVDVKSSRPRNLNKRFKALSWSFSFKKQALVCDFIVCFCLNSESGIERILLVPSEFFRDLVTVSVSCNSESKSKWLDYAVSPESLNEFFESVAELNVGMNQ